jgi:hypothetical protein
MRAIRQRTTTLTATAIALLAFSAAAAASSAAMASERNIGQESRGQVAAICAGTGGHYQGAGSGAYGCEGPGRQWDIICKTDLSCLIETGLAANATPAVFDAGPSIGLHNPAGGGGNAGGSTGGLGGSTGGSGGSSGSGGCICNQIGGGGGNTPVTPSPGPVGVGTIGGSTIHAH